MGLITIKIENLIIQSDEEKLDLILDKLEGLLEDPDGKVKQGIFDTLTVIKQDLEDTV